MKKYGNFLILLILIIPIGNVVAQGAFFDEADAFFKEYVLDGQVKYGQLTNNNSLTSLLDQVAKADLQKMDANTRKAFLINAYNLLVIKGATDHYPLQSVLKIDGFFDAKKHRVGGNNITLNKLEKDLLLKAYGDARIHFVVVCGALDCPPITSFAYRPDQIEQQIDRQTRKALNNNNFIKVDKRNGEVQLSQIFEWYSNDFGGSKKKALEFINRYRRETIPTTYKVGFYEYDWSLNAISALNRPSSEIRSDGSPSSNNASRYVVSSTIPRGTFEVKIFNNLYTQQTGPGGDLRDRATFLTTTTSVLYGLKPKFNIGFDIRYRHVRYNSIGDSPLSVLTFNDSPSSRQGVTGIGPKIRYAPFENLPNFSIQSALWLPTSDDLAGNGDDLPYIDWNGATWFTQVFNDFSIGGNFSLFTELDIVLEDIGANENGHLNRFSTPATLILSYFPNAKTTLYALGGFSPFWQEEFDYFAQIGTGAKYQFTPKFELELLYTWFTNDFLQTTGGRAATYNLGIRFNL